MFALLYLYIINVYTCTHTYMHHFSCQRVFISAYVHCVCIFRYVCVYTDICISVYLYINIQVYVYVYVYVYIHDAYFMRKCWCNSKRRRGPNADDRSFGAKVGQDGGWLSNLTGVVGLSRNSIWLSFSDFVFRVEEVNKHFVCFRKALEGFYRLGRGG